MDLRLKEFKDRFPEEYNEYYSTLVSEKKECSCGDNCCSCDCEDCGEKDWNCDTFEFEMNSNNGKPEIKARVNGKPADEDRVLKLFESNPEVMHLAKTLGILPEGK